MNIVVLLVLMATGLAGMFLLASWLGADGHRASTSQPGGLPNGIVVGHVGTAIIVFVLWLFFVVLDTTALAWTAAGFFFAASGLGLGLFRRWRLQVRHRQATRTAGDQLSVAAVAIHGALAAATALFMALAITRL